jgi:hypothetical protein
MLADKVFPCLEYIPVEKYPHPRERLVPPIADLPPVGFTDDPAVQGTWNTIDSVPSIDWFDPNDITYGSGNWLKSLTFNSSGVLLVNSAAALSRVGQKIR